VALLVAAKGISRLIKSTFISLKKGKRCKTGTLWQAPFTGVNRYKYHNRTSCWFFFQSKHLDCILSKDYYYFTINHASHKHICSPHGVCGHCTSASWNKYVFSSCWTFLIVSLLEIYKNWLTIWKIVCKGVNFVDCTSLGFPGNFKCSKSMQKHTPLGREWRWRTPRSSNFTLLGPHWKLRRYTNYELGNLGSAFKDSISSFKISSGFACEFFEYVILWKIVLFIIQKHLANIDGFKVARAATMVKVTLATREGRLLTFALLAGMIASPRTCALLFEACAG